MIRPNHEMIEVGTGGRRRTSAQVHSNDPFGIELSPRIPSPCNSLLDVIDARECVFKHLTAVIVAAIGQLA